MTAVVELGAGGNSVTLRQSKRHAVPIRDDGGRREYFRRGRKTTVKLSPFGCGKFPRQRSRLHSYRLKERIGW